MITFLIILLFVGWVIVPLVALAIWRKTSTRPTPDEVLSTEYIEWLKRVRQDTCTRCFTMLPGFECKNCGRAA